jgi:phosphoglycolate phosphatase-like HAD superfamily hydrolase
VIQDLEEQLTRAHIRIVRYTPGGALPSIGKGKGLIVITGHSSDELAMFVHELGTKGAFEGNYVMFNSCETPLTRQLITEMNTRYGAMATFAQQGKIKVNDLDGFLVDFSESLQKVQRASFRDLMLNALHNHGLNGIWTICEKAIHSVLPYESA